MKNFFKTKAFIIVALLGTSVFVLLQSPLAPYAKSIIGIDSGIFIYSARQILDGQIMYKDIVDHKGPFLYFINAIALLIFNRNYIGIWIFELLSLFTASIIMYKTARFFTDKFSSLLAVICSMLFLVICLGRGNMTEEWALPYLSVALYIFVDYLKRNNPLTIVRLFILSFSFVLTFMLRANMVAIWAGFGVVLLIKWIVDKKYGELIRNLSFILLFILLSLFPFFLYFYYNGALSDAIYLIFKFNMFEYAQQSNLFIFILRTILKISYIGIIIPIIFAAYMVFRERTAVNRGVLLALVFTVLVCSIGKNFPHYYIIFLPILVIPYSYIFTIIKENIFKKKCIFVYILLFLLFSYNIVFIGRQLMLIVDNYSEKSSYSIKIEKLTEIINQNTKPTDKILEQNLSPCLYLYSHRVCATRFPYPLVLSSFAQEHYVKDAEKALPKLIIRGVKRYPLDRFNVDPLLFNKYQLIETVEDTEVWKLKE